MTVSPRGLSFAPGAVAVLSTTGAAVTLSAGVVSLGVESRPQEKRTTSPSSNNDFFILPLRSRFHW